MARAFPRVILQETDRRTSVVIPALNEERNIAWVLERLPSCVDEVLVVDGRSTDRTIPVALEVRPDARIVEEKAPGKGAALRAGFAAARGRYVVMLDADGSMDPAEIPRFVDYLEAGYDLVKGTRFTDGGGSADITWLRRFGNRLLTQAVNYLYGECFTDLCYGYLAFRKEALRVLGLCASGFEIETEIVVNAVRTGLRIGEVPSHESRRLNGESNLRTFRDGQRVLRTLIRKRLTPLSAPPWPSTPEPSTAATLIVVPEPAAVGNGNTSAPGAVDGRALGARAGGEMLAADDDASAVPTSLAATGSDNARPPIGGTGSGIDPVTV
jgi:Glycosyl transferase family 2